MTNVTIADACAPRQITGRFVKQYSQGITIEDARGIIWYATMDRVLTPLPQQSSTPIKHANGRII